MNRIPPVVDRDGAPWHLYQCSYPSADGVLSFDIRAVSMEHAAAPLHEIRAGAKLDGQVVGEEPA